MHPTDSEVVFVDMDTRTRMNLDKVQLWVWSSVPSGCGWFKSAPRVAMPTVREVASLSGSPRVVLLGWTLSRLSKGLSLGEFAQVDKISVCDRIAGST